MSRPDYTEINFYGPKPTQLEKFDWQSPLTRANILDWVITGFAVSRGQLYLHAPFLNWCDLNLNYYSAGAIGDFTHAAIGFEQLLSRQERKRLKDAYLNQPEHGPRIKETKREQRGQRIVWWQIADRVTDQLSEAVKASGIDEPTDLPTNLWPDALEGISKAEFLRRIQDELKRVQEDPSPNSPSN